MIEKTIEISMLYDFYHQLLTEKQRELIDLYYNQDFSLGEIAEQYEISRQAVYDTIRRTEKLLYSYEEKLKLVELFHNRTVAVEGILQEVILLEDKIDLGCSKEEARKQIQVIRKLFDEFLSN